MATREHLPEHLLIVRAVVPAEIEADWNRWYNEVHLPEITACPGFLSSRRYVSDSGGMRRYVAVYALAGPEAMASPEFASRRGWGPFAGRVEATVEVYSGVAGGVQP
jgi:hypothetical protein